MIREIERIECEGEDGLVYTVIEYQEFRQIRTLDGKVSEVPGMKQANLTDGSHVNVSTEADGTTIYKSLKNDIVMRRIS